MNGQAFPCGRVAGALRKRLFREHLGLMGEDLDKLGISLDDPCCNEFYRNYWKAISKRNTDVYEDVSKRVALITGLLGIWSNAKLARHRLSIFRFVKINWAQWLWSHAKSAFFGSLFYENTLYWIRNTCLLSVLCYCCIRESSMGVVMTVSPFK